MKPKRIFLVRHGESEGNLDRNTYAVKPDYMLLLTDKGKQQASIAGKKLKELIKNEKVIFYVSPIWRARMTFEELYANFDKENVKWREDPRLREQEWGHLRNVETNIRIDEERDNFGAFYYRIPDGESCADVYDRLSVFFNSLHRDFEKTNYPDNVVIVSHGMTIRLFLMKWFYWTVEEFETLSNPKNCEIIELNLIPETGKYKIINELRRKSMPEKFKYTWTHVTPRNIL